MTKAQKWNIAASILGCFTIMCSLCMCTVHANEKANRIKNKVEQVKSLCIKKKLSGKDPSSMIDKLKRVKSFLDSKKPDQAEKLLNSILATEKSKTITQSNVKSAIVEPVSLVFNEIEKVNISGYTKSAMEPFISRDNKYLMFNGLNGPNEKTKIHIAERTGSNKFSYIGKVPGVKSDAKDLAPAMDDSGNFYFTSLRSYSKNLKTLYHGMFSDKSVVNVKPISGNISSKIPGWLNMDCDVSKDGKLFIYSRARFNPGGHVPAESNLRQAFVENGKIIQDMQSDLIMKNINTDILEYAPCISKNGLELFFNRASILMSGNTEKGAKVRILMATRKSVHEPFSKPVRIKKIDGFVEGPTISSDGKELFFHKREKDGFRIFRAFNRID